ncbi:MAG: tetratricopeptide repeat protein [Gammaproteobacteria bacterium]|nr:tetratricopeptide repeat protein [Gammaproteobacteria bacterium]
MTNPSRYQVFIITVLLLSVAPFLGLASGSHSFLGFDDRVNILENQHIAALTWDNIVWMFTGSKLGVYEPLSWLIKATIVEVFGLSPRAFQVTTLVLHFANVVLLWLVAGALLRQLLPTIDQQKIRVIAALMALAYGVHPLRVEVVAWVSGQSYAVGGFFCFCCLYSYIKYCERQKRHQPGYAWLYASAVFYLASIFGKSAMVMLPAWLLLIDWAVYRRRQYWRIVLEKAPFAIIAIATIVMVALVNDKAMGSNHLVLSWPEKFGRALLAIYIYPLQTLWPPNLLPAYAVPRWGISIWDKVPLLAMIGLISIIVAAIRHFAQNPWPLVILLAYGVFLLPVLGFVQHGNPILVADRYTYAAMVPFYIAAASVYLKAGFDGQSQRLFGIAFAVYLGLLAWLTTTQVSYWRSDKTLWSHALELQPENAFAANNLGFRYYSEGDYETARKYLEWAYLSEPHNEFPLLNLGVTYYELDRCDLAIEHYQRAAQTHHANSDGLFNNMGNCFVKLGRYQESLSHFERALEINPKHEKARNSLHRITAYLNGKK